MRLTAAILMVCALASTQRPSEYFLDLLTYRHVDQEASAAHIPKGSSSVREGHSKVLGELTVSVEELDRSAYAPGEDIIAEITIANTGTTAVSIPWCPDRSALGRNGVVDAILALEVRTANGGVLLGRLQPQALYGSEDVTGTLQTLAPGDRARIRMPSRWNNSEVERDSILRQPGGRVRIFAVYQHDLQEDRSRAGVPVVFVAR